MAEQNSVDLAWALLMEDNFKDLRKVICATDEERKRFRQVSLAQCLESLKPLFGSHDIYLVPLLFPVQLVVNGKISAIACVSVICALSLESH